MARTTICKPPGACVDRGQRRLAERLATGRDGAAGASVHVAAHDPVGHVRRKLERRRDERSTRSVPEGFTSSDDRTSDCCGPPKSLLRAQTCARR